jgi:hypothetical protein
MISRMAMIMTLITITGGFSYSYAQMQCPKGSSVKFAFASTLWRKPTESEISFWTQKAKDAGYKIEPGDCHFIEEDKKKVSGSIMEWAIAESKKVRFQVSEISRMIDRVFQKATGNSAATQQEHAAWDDVVINQKITAPELFARIIPDLVIKEVVDIPNDAKSVNVQVVNQGKFSTRHGSTLLLEINNGTGCTGKVSNQAEFNVPTIKAGEAIWVKVISTERLKLSGLERLAYKLTADAKQTVVELDEANNGKCVPAYIVK